ncbi:MAG: diguanylate cyclase protein [Herbinix sp.]|jgi:diguanylate cyclase (GGDEF)-like protein|nr:diguanylate cyclase protein [Herbinix sp.]
MKSIYQSKLFKQLIAAIGVLIILAIGIPGAFTLFYITPNVVEERYHRVMINDVKFLSNRLDWLLAKSLGDVEYLSNKITLSDPSKLEEAAKTLDIFVSSSAIFTGGTVTDKNGIMQLFFSSSQGIIELKHKNDISHRDYIQYPLAKHESYLSDVIITESNPSPVIFVSSIVMEGSQASGVLALSINLWNENNIFHSLVNGFQEKKQGSIYVVDGRGTIVFHTDKKMVGHKIHPDILSQIAENKENMLVNLPMENGKLDIALGKLKKNNWVVVYEMDHEEIYSMSKIDRYMLLSTMVLVVILGFIASGIFARIILKPLEEITNATEQVAAGDFDQRINCKGHNDFQGVAHNFNIMTTNLRVQYDQLEKLSMQDYLTGLANRRYFEYQFQLELERACRLGHVSTLLILDIDDFKKINDKFGHLEGDKALKLLASTLKEQIREVDLPVRFGGEEFLILLPETSLEQGKVVAEKIRKKVSQLKISTRKGNITFTISIGMAGLEQDTDFTCTALNCVGDKLLKRADEALYQAKSMGKNRTEIWKSPNS